ncbi:hypothetical protein OIU77_022513 [Salix suchowensis]|uniref:Uncharacterized protein n=1 Tax=Salix suchowensis TaxID=1278906 RepID=A0ABQ9C0H0_9ROSI|nr:hypothetical protein OIU77_022513 [Salix suchowensis]
MNRRDPLPDQIQISLQNLSTNQSTCSIFKVPRVLRSVNDRAYEPEILSIGPYHRGKDDLKMMEEHKKHYLQMFLQRRPGNSLTSYVAAMRGLEERARRYYHQPVSLGTDAFVEMLLLDGCFIVELLCKTVTSGLQQGDPVTGNLLVLSTISHDMLLLENQLPFCVLLKLFSMAMPNERVPLVDKASGFFKWMFPGSRLERNNIISSQECKHLLDLVYHNWLLRSPDVLPRESEAMNIKSDIRTSGDALRSAAQCMDGEAEASLFQQSVVTDFLCSCPLIASAHLLANLVYSYVILQINPPTMFSRLEHIQYPAEEIHAFDMDQGHISPVLGSSKG